MEPIKSIPAVDTNRAWEKLKTRLETDGLMPAAKTGKQQGSPMWIRMAAGLLILIAAGSMIYLGIGKLSSEKYIALSNAGDNITLVKTLEDGSVVYLAANTILSVPASFDPSERKVKVSGQAYFDVTHNPDQPFRILAANSVIEVIGTAFSIETRDENSLTLFVEEGLVRVYVPGNEQVNVAAGEVLKILGNTWNKSSGTDLVLTLWRQERMHFKDENLLNVLSVINRNFSSNLSLADDSLANRQMTVTFFNNSMPTIIELLCLSMNLEAIAQPDSSIILTPR